MGEVREYADAELAAMLPWPAKDANKYTRGKVVLVAGCARYPGAACLAARAAQRMGAGYTEVRCAPEAVACVRGASPSLVVAPWDDVLEIAALERACGRIARGADCYPIVFNDLRLCAARDALFPPADARHPMAYLVGSGLDAAEPEAAALVGAVLTDAQAPVVVDGGGLAALAAPEGQAALARRRAAGRSTVVTPHAGEAARLARPLGLEMGDAAEDARALAKALGVVCVLKGPVTHVSDGERTARMAQGTPALAKAGTGDVLAGMLAALLAQGLDAVDAGVLAATLHALAGRAAAERLTAICVAAEDVVEALPQAISALCR